MGKSRCDVAESEDEHYTGRLLAMKRDWVDVFLQVGIWLLFVALLVPAGVVGYVIGH